MRTRRLLWIGVALVVVACQAPSDGSSSPQPGQTSYTQGTPVTRSETTVVSDTTSGPQAAGEVTLTLDRSTYAAGGDVTMTIRNTGRDTLGYNPCSNRTIERQNGTSWTPHAEPDRICTMELRLLNAGQTQTAGTDLPSPLPAGTYRIVLLLSRQTTAGGTVRAVSSPFTVR